MIVAAVKETFPGERRVALVPAVIPSLAKAGIEVLIEAAPAEAAGFSDAQYVEKGAKIADSRAAAFAADCLVQVAHWGPIPRPAWPTFRSCGRARP